MSNHTVSTVYTIAGVEYDAQVMWVEEARLGFEHGCLTVSLAMKAPSCGQSTPILVLDDAPVVGGSRQPHAVAGFAISSFLRVAQVDNWSAIKGRPMFVLRAVKWDFIKGLASLDGEEFVLLESITNYAEWSNGRTAASEAVK